MKKHTALFVCLCLLVCLLSSCVGDLSSDIPPVNDESTGNSENDVAADTAIDSEMLVSALSSATDENIVGIYPEDYNSDGTYEAYAITSKKEIAQDALHFQGISVWFIKGETATLLLSGDYYLTPKSWKFRDKILFCVDRYNSGDACSNVFFVSGNGAYSYGEFPARLERKNDESGEFYAFVSATDALYRNATRSYQGETVKPYYLYFDGNFFCEYAGLLINPEDLSYYKGAQEILSSISEGGYTVDEIFYRENGIINMNLSKEVGGGIIYFENVTLGIDDENIHLLTKNSGDEVAGVNAELSESVIEGRFSDSSSYSFKGLYCASAFYEIAVLPAAFR